MLDNMEDPNVWTMGWLMQSSEAVGPDNDSIPEDDPSDDTRSISQSDDVLASDPHSSVHHHTIEASINMT